LEELSVDGRVILKCILKMKCEVIHWILVAQCKDHSLAVLNTIMNLQVP